jgi:hypothetical protein
MVQWSDIWLQIQRSGFDSPRYNIFWEVIGLERGLFSLVSTTEELLGRKSSGSGLESRDYILGMRHADHVAPSARKSWHPAYRRIIRLCVPERRTLQSKYVVCLRVKWIVLWLDSLVTLTCILSEFHRKHDIIPSSLKKFPESDFLN